MTGRFLPHTKWWAKERLPTSPDRAGDGQDAAGVSGGTRIIERVSGDIYETTGEYRRPGPMDDFLDPETGNVYSGDASKAKQIILRCLPR